MTSICGIEQCEIRSIILLLLADHEELFKEYLKNNKYTVKQLLTKKHPNDKGVLWNMYNADILLDEYVDMQKVWTFCLCERKFFWVPMS